MIGRPAAITVLGYAGVDGFFVIFGVIICQVAERSSTVVEFVVPRARRIYPVYWVVLAFAGVLVACGVDMGVDWMPRLPTTNYVFVLTPTNRFVPHAWTLVFELIFMPALRACC